MEKPHDPFIVRWPEARNVDFSDPALPPGFDAEKINAGIVVAAAKIGERGWQGDTLCVLKTSSRFYLVPESAKSAR
jgi:hypothetical protein